jgi:surface protein
MKIFLYKNIFYSKIKKMEKLQEDKTTIDIVYKDGKKLTVDAKQFSKLNYSKMVSININGTLTLINPKRMFFYNLNIISITGNLVLIGDASEMFQSSLNFNGDLSNWDVSKVTDMSSMFNNIKNFNGDLSNWDVSKVTNMAHMFNEASNFNGDLSEWNVSSVTDMNYMFYQAKKFNGDLSEWDVSNVTDMGYMFCEAENFNSDITRWNVSKVEDFDGMFYGAKNFTFDVSNWGKRPIKVNSSEFKQLNSDEKKKVDSDNEEKENVDSDNEEEQLVDSDNEEEQQLISDNEEQVALDNKQLVDSDNEEKEQQVDSDNEEKEQQVDSDNEEQKVDSDNEEEKWLDAEDFIEIIEDKVPRCSYLSMVCDNKNKVCGDAKIENYGDKEHGDTPWPNVYDRCSLHIYKNGNIKKGNIKHMGDLYSILEEKWNEE